MNEMENVIVTLPCKLIETVREMASPRGQNEFIVGAIESFIEKERQIMRAELIAGYKATAAESLAITKEWETIGDEAWLKHVPPYEEKEPPHDVQDMQDV